MRPKTPDEALAYIRTLFAPEDEVLQAVVKDTDPKLAGMQIGSEEGKILQVILTMIRAKKVVEIGTFMAYSTIWMARALPEDGTLFALEKNPDHAQKAQAHLDAAGCGGKVSLLIGEAKENLPKLAQEAPFDAVFIDADKGGYLDYLDWAERHLRPGGVIIGDNSLLFGTAYLDEPPEGVSRKSWQTMREFNRRLSDPARYTSILLPTFEGMTVGVRIT